MDDLLNEFLTETAESIDVVDVELVKLEQDPNNKDVLDNIFRLVHTIKGTCGFLGLPRLESVAHASENVLGKFRDGELRVSEHAVTVILESLDCIKEILSGLETTEEEPDGDDADLISRLDAIAEGSMAPAQEEKTTPDEDTIDGEIIEPTLGRSLKAGEVTLDELEAVFASTPGPEDTPPQEAPPETGTICDRIGGDSTIASVAKIAATALEADQGLSHYFSGFTLEQNIGRLTGLMLAIFKDDVDTAESIGRQLVLGGGFGHNEFGAFVDLIKNALAGSGVNSDVVDEAVMSFELVRVSLVQTKNVVATTNTTASSNSKKSTVSPSESKRSTQSIRVNVELLEDLMNMVSELVLTRNQLLQITRNLDKNELAVPLQRLSQTTTELQENVMKTRMQPIGNAWAKLPRIVRDLTVELDKKIDLEMLGAETELDRQVLELIKDPLTHMVRNSADHGIERPAERLAMGKTETGSITLNAYHEGGHIILQIKDDGRGIPVQKLKEKILEKGLATPIEVADMSDSQIQNHIFHPGFSTAEQVTNVSGRGVGMDVVRSNIEKIGGTVDMTSIEGKGTTFLIKIPLTLAIVAGLIVEVSGERYAIPQISVLELVRASNGGEHRIERIKNSPVLRLRKRLLPLVFLNEVMGFKTKEEIENNDSGTQSDDFIIVGQVGTFTFGIVVDQVFDTEEIVVKPVAPVLKNIDIYSGNTILGDGSVIMILDPNGIASLASSAVGERRDDEAEQEVHARQMIANENESLLLFRAGRENPKAVPLSLIARLEDIDVDKIEESDGKHVVQYRGNLMPLILGDQNMTLATKGRQPVLVFSDREHTMGLAVDAILDIVEDKFDVTLTSNRPGIMGSAIIAGKATEVIDVTHALSEAFPQWFKRVETGAENMSTNARILLVDDSDFFRNMLKPVLTVAGFDVTAVNAAGKALNLRDHGEMFDLIVSDIEMPEMDGFDFARTVKADGIWQGVPLIALTGLTGTKDIGRGRQVGFDDYIEKFDKETLLTSLNQQLKLQGDAA